MMGRKVMGVFVPKCSQKHGKGYRKLKDFRVSNVCEEVEFYGEYNGSKYNLVVLASL